MNKFTRRTVIAAACAAAAMTFGPMSFAQQAPEKKDVTIAVGGKSLYYYLPLSIAEQLGYFKDEGLNVKIVDFQGGSRSLQAVVGGSADVVSGAFEHTISMQAKKQPMTAFVLQGRAPQLALVVSNKTMKDYKQLSDLKGKKVGVQRATIFDRYATDVFAPAGIEVVRYASQEEVFLDLVAGRIDASLADAVSIQFGFLQTDAGKGFATVGPAFTDRKYFGEGIGVAVRKGDTALVEKFNAAIDAIRANGKYDAIRKKYFDYDIYGE